MTKRHSVTKPPKRRSLSELRTSAIADPEGKARDLTWTTYDPDLPHSIKMNLELNSSESDPGVTEEQNACLARDTACFTWANLKAEMRRRFTINTWRGPTLETRDGSKDLFELNDDIDPRWVHTGHKPSQDRRCLSAETRRACWAAISQRAPVPLALPASETENLISFWKGYNKGWLQKEKLDMKLEVPVQRSCA